jgi:zinc protease
VAYEGVSIELSAIAERVPAAVDVLASVVQRPALDRPGLDEDFSWIRQGAIEQADRAGRTLAIWQPLYGFRHWLMRPARGSSETLLPLTPDDVRRFYAGHYQPEHSALIAVGAVKTREFVELARLRFGAWPRGVAVAQPSPLPVPSLTDGYIKILGFDRKGSGAVVNIGLPCVGSLHPDSLTFALIAAVLSNGRHSRARRALREHGGATYMTGAACHARANAGEFVIEFDTTTEGVGLGLERMFEEIAALRRTPLGSAELEMAKHFYAGTLAEMLGTNADTANDIAWSFLWNRPKDHYATLESRIRAVSAADVQRVASTYFKLEHMRLVVLGDAPLLHPQLQRYGNIVWR